MHDRSSTVMPRRLVWRVLTLAAVLACLAVGLSAADPAWTWVGPAGPDTVSLLLMGDVDIQLRADPATAFTHLAATLKRADVVYCNLEGMLVAPQGKGIDIPDKGGWQHPGPEAAQALKADHIAVVGVANNTAYGRANIMKTLALLDASGIKHTGAGANLEAAHKPAIVEAHGVKIGFLQYTARWYLPEHSLATATEPGVAKIASRDGLTVDPADMARVRDDIRRLRPLVDVLIVSHHNRDGATDVQFGPGWKGAAAKVRRDQTIPEEYQRQFDHAVLDAGADLVYDHGTHTVQGVEVYKGKAILYAVGHSAFDQPGYEKLTKGMIVHVIVQHKQIVHVSFVPMTRDAHNDVLMLDPASPDGQALLEIVEKSTTMPLHIEGREVVLVDKTKPPVAP